MPEEIWGRRLGVGDLLAEDSVRLPDRLPEHKDVVLGGEMTSDRWTINGRTYDDTRPLTVRQGQLTRLRVVNQTMMLHPIHLHGRNFAVRNGGRARKGTILVPAMQRIDIDVLPDNPGAWMPHGHNAVHMETGMTTRLECM